MLEAALQLRLRLALNRYQGRRIFAECLDEEVDDIAPKFSHGNLTSGDFIVSILADRKAVAIRTNPDAKGPDPPVEAWKIGFAGMAILATLFDHRSADVVLDRSPDVIDIGDEFRLAFDVEPARPRQVDVDRLLKPSRPARKHQHAIGEEHRLVDLMGDEQHGLAALFPDAQELGLH